MQVELHLAARMNARIGQLLPGRRRKHRFQAEGLHVSAELQSHIPLDRVHPGASRHGSGGKMGFETVQVQRALLPVDEQGDPLR